MSEKLIKGTTMIKSNLAISHTIFATILALLVSGAPIPVVAQSGSDSVMKAVETLRKSNSLPFPLPTMFNPMDTGWEPNTVSEPFPRVAREAMMTTAAALIPGPCARYSALWRIRSRQKTD